MPESFDCRKVFIKPGKVYWVIISMHRHPPLENSVLYLFIYIISVLKIPLFSWYDVNMDVLMIKNECPHIQLYKILCLKLQRTIMHIVTQPHIKDYVKESSQNYQPP